MTSTAADLSREPVVDVSVVLPVFNEQGHIGDEIGRIRKSLDASPYSYELVVVDDGSTDASAAELDRLDDVELIRLPENRGAGFARKVGTLAAAGRVIVWTDVDMTYPNDRIAELVADLEGFDQVVGARTTEEGTAKAFRRGAKWLIRRLASYLLQTPIPDLNSGFRAFRSDVARQFLHLLPAGFSCVSTMTMAFLANGYSVRHVPIDYAARAGRSKFHPWKDTKRYFVQVVRMILSYEPLRFFLPIGGVLMLVGVAKLAFDMVDKDFRVATNTIVVLFAAFQVIIVGLLADLIVRLTRPRGGVDPRLRGPL